MSMIGEQLVTLVGTLGFPIVITAYLLKERADIRGQTREDKKESEMGFTKALQENTAVLQELKTVIRERVR